MNEPTIRGLELRRAVSELRGWTNIQYAHRAGPGTECGFVGDAPNKAEVDVWLPAVESDPAISESWLEEICKEKGWLWSVFKSSPASDGVPMVSCLIYEDAPDGLSVLRYGSTPSEARALAMYVAMGGKQ